MEPTGLVFAGFAVVSSVGHSYPETCAAIRAGLSRATPLPHYLVLDSSVQEATPLVGHPLRGLSEGFFGPGLWVRLARLCLDELLARSVVAPIRDAGFWSRSALVALVPDPNSDRFAPDDGFEPDYVRRQLLDVLMTDLGLPLPTESLFTMGAGGATLFRALAKMQEPLLSGRFDRVVMLCLDSMLDDMTLDWLDAAGRLKGPDAPSGLSPGEAGVAIVVERAGVTGASDPRTHVALLGVGYGAHTAGAPAMPGAQGVRLAGAIRQALAAVETAGPFGGPVVSDLNGEVWKAMEVARARMELMDELDDAAPWTLPCSSVGDVGCALSALCTASASWGALRTKPNLPTLVFGLDTDGEVGALSLAALH